MKSHSKIKKMLLAGLASGLLIGTTGSVLAHDGDWDENHHYYVDKHGYWDEHDHYQKFIVHHGHHGYWDRRGDKEVFITVKTW